MTSNHAQYAKLLSATAVRLDPPRSAVIDGRLVCGRLPAAYLASLGWYPLEGPESPLEDSVDSDDSVDSAEYPHGFHWEPRYAYDDPSAPSAIARSWVRVADPPPPPRTFSKLRLVSAMMDGGVWPEVKAWIEEAGLYDLFLAAQDFREDNPYFMRGKALLQERLGWTDEQVEAVLETAAV